MKTLKIDSRWKGTGRSVAGGDRWKSRLLLPILLLVIGANGCSFSGIGTDLGRGLTGSLAERSDTIGAGLGGGLIRSIRDTLVGDITRQRLALLLDSVIAVAGSSANRQSVGLRDSLLGLHTRDWLLGLERDLTSDLVLASAGISNNLLGDESRMRIRRLMNEVLNSATLLYVAALRDTLVGPGLRDQLGLIRDELLGEGTRLAIDSILVGASGRIQEITRGEEGFFKRNLTEILWTVGVIIALLLILGGFVVARVRRYRKMLELLTFQIHEIPDQATYNQLTRRIQKSAQERGVEGKLRQFLKDQGLVGEGSWNPE